MVGDEQDMQVDKKELLANGILNDGNALPVWMT